MNQTKGFDCPGCAWPDPVPGHRHRNEYCENGAKHVNDEATSRRLTASFFARYSVGELAGKSDRWLNQQGRLTEPLVKRAGSDHYEPVNWSEALGLLAEELRRLDSPDEAVFYTSGRVRQRGRVRVSALRARLRHQQSAGLFQHVPRVERCRAARDAGRRQGGCEPAGHPPLRSGLSGGPESGQQSSADAHRAGADQAQRRTYRRRESTAGGGTHPVQASAGGPRCDRPGHPDRRSVPAYPGRRRSRLLPGAESAAAGGRGRPSRHGARPSVHRGPHQWLHRIRRASPTAVLGRCANGQRTHARGDREGTRPGAPQ